VVALLLVVYRSLPALGLGLLPVTTGALVASLPWRSDSAPSTASLWVSALL